jgi:predicted ATPase
MLRGAPGEVRSRVRKVPHTVQGSDVPQANSLAKAREVTRAVRDGATSVERIGEKTHLSTRHADYYLQAARVLDWIAVEGNRWRVTDRGAELLRARPGSPAEASVFAESIRQSRTIQQLAPALLAERSPSVEAIAANIMETVGLAGATALRRAKTLLSWRKQALAPQQRQLVLRDSGARPQTEPAPEGAGTMIEVLRLHNFKNFRDATLQLAPLTVVVGPNASGKSNIRDAFRFLHGISRGYTLAEIIGEKWVEGGVLQWRGIRGGIKEAAYWDKTMFSFEVTFTAPDRGKRRKGIYRIEIDVGALDQPPRLVSERLIIEGRGQFVFDSHPPRNAPSQGDPLHLTIRLRKDQHGFVGPQVRVFSDRPALSQLAEHPDVESEEVRGHVRLALAAFRSMRFLDLSPEAMRMPSIPGQRILGDRGENLSSVLQSIVSAPGRKTELIDWIRELTPLDVSDFRFPADPAGRILVTLIEEDGHETSAYSASDGTLRFLAMIGAFLGPEPARFYFFEELENGLHATRLHLLLQLIERQTERGLCQVVATTHSPQLLGLLGKDSQEGAVVVQRPAGQPDAKVTRLVDLQGSNGKGTKDLSRLLASGWFENVAEFMAEP